MLQAMDRAQRLGQQRIVNVYQLLTRDSLEDKIMGLQPFKLEMATFVVSQDSVSLKSMYAGRLLDPFTLGRAPWHKVSPCALTSRTSCACRLRQCVNIGGLHDCLPFVHY